MNAADVPLTRESALVRLHAFVADAAVGYGARRNFVDAAGAHTAVSRLSAALRRRLLSEEEVVRVVLAAHPFPAVEKFIAEVFWRTYWKGWLENHRGLWDQFVQDVQAEKVRLDAIPAIGSAYRKAAQGQTGIEAFDHWASELARTGYLHNWARMQVASIWIFTLGLPWQLGADWMSSHLLDADPASNTLSWRWVAGLHTAGKTYLADEERLSAMTNGALKAEGLATSATPPSPGPLPSPTDLREPVQPDPKAASLILLTCEDLSLETELDLSDVRGIGIVQQLAGSQADRTSLTDAVKRASMHWGREVHEAATWPDLAAIAEHLGCTQVVTGFATTGPTAEALAAFRPYLSERGLLLTEHQRRWDRLAWPFCRKGFFQLKSRIPQLLEEQGILST